MSEQFPSTEGDVEGEVAQRSADGSKGTAYRKTFRAQGDREGFAVKDNPVHEANKLAMLQEALNRGLHPKGEPKFVAISVHSTNRRGVETCDLTYSVSVVPAVIDETNTEDTVSPAELIEKPKTRKRTPAPKAAEED